MHGSWLGFCKDFKQVFFWGMGNPLQEKRVDLDWLIIFFGPARGWPSATRFFASNQSKVPEGLQGWLFSKVVATQMFSYFHPDPWGFMIQFDEHIDSKTPSIKGGNYCWWWFRNQARKPVEIGSLSHYLQGFDIPGDCLGFFPQQYVSFRDGKSVKEKHHTQNWWGKNEKTRKQFFQIEVPIESINQAVLESTCR